MKKVLISIIIMLVCFELNAQIIKRYGVKVHSEEEKPKEIRFDYKGIKIRSFGLYLSKLENQLLRAALTFKPNKKTFENLDLNNFKNLTIDFQVVSLEKGKRQIYESRLEIDKEDIVDKRTLYSSRELFSFSNYNWDWDDVPFGTTEKGTNISITKVEMNGEKLNALPDLFKGIKLEFKYKDSKSRFEDLSEELLNRGIYPNKEAFEILFESNPKVFYKKKKNLNSKELSTLTYPKLEGIEEANSSFRKYEFNKDELQKIQSELAFIIKSVKLKKIFSRDSKKIKKQLQEILNFLSGALKSGISVNENTGKLLISGTRYALDVINEDHKPKPKISGEDLDNFNSIIDDVTFIIFLLNNPSKSSGSILDKKAMNNVARLVNYNLPTNEFLGDDVSVYVVANTFEDLKSRIPANDYVVKCVPWGYRNENLNDPRMKDIIRTFPDPSTPTKFPDLLPVAHYCFWVEDQDENKIPLKANGSWQADVDIRPEHRKTLKWLLRLFRYKKPFEVLIELWLK